MPVFALFFFAGRLAATAGLSEYVVTESLTENSTHRISVSFEATGIHEAVSHEAYVETRKVGAPLRVEDTAQFMGAEVNPKNQKSRGYSLEISPLNLGVELVLIVHAWQGDKEVEKQLLVRAQIGEDVLVNRIGCKCQLNWSKPSQKGQAAEIDLPPSKPSQ